MEATGSAETLVYLSSLHGVTLQRRFCDNLPSRVLGRVENTLTFAGGLPSVFNLC
jgi:hypothetical protein